MCDSLVWIIGIHLYPDRDGLWWRSGCSRAGVSVWAAMGPRWRWRGKWWMGLIAGEAQRRVALSVLQPAGLSAWCVCCRHMLYGPLPVCLASWTGTCATKTRSDTTLLSSGTLFCSTFFCSGLSFSIKQPLLLRPSLLYSNQEVTKSSLKMWKTREVSVTTYAEQCKWIN